MSTTGLSPKLGRLPSGALLRAHDSLTPSEREQLLQAVDAIDDNDPLTLAATGGDDLGAAP